MIDISSDIEAALLAVDVAGGLVIGVWVVVRVFSWLRAVIFGYYGWGEFGE